MKAIQFKTVTALVMSLSACACIPSVQEPAQTATPAPAPVAVPAPAPKPTPAPVPVVNEPAYDNYLDAPQTPGTWQYTVELDEKLAVFGQGKDAQFIVVCNSSGGIELARAVQSGGSAPRTMEITTETTRRSLIAELDEGYRRLLTVSLSARDPLLDAIAITKGRIAIGVEGERTLYVPAWVEITRVIEDCR